MTCRAESLVLAMLLALRAAPALAEAEPAPEAQGATIAFHRVLRPFRAGVVFGVGLSYALPIGTFGYDNGKAVAMDDVDGNLWLPRVDLGYQLIEPIFLGGHFAMGFGDAGGEMARECTDSGLSCSTQAVDFGIDAEYRLRTESGVSPWVGLGVSVETQTLRRRHGDAKADLHSSGLDMSLSLGADVRLGSGFTIGPCVQYRPGTFFSTDVERLVYVEGAQDPSFDGLHTYASASDIPGGGWHHWIAFMLRGRWYAGER
jgi:hypothetical protein